MTKTRELSQFFLLIGGSVAVAVLTVYFLITNYGPSGSYQLGSIVLSPEVISQLSYEEVEPGSGAKRRYVLDKIELVFPDQDARRWSRIEVPQGEYARVYELLSIDKSITPTDEIQASFLRGDVMSLSIQVRPDRSLSGAWQQRSFQEIQFAPEGDYYRVELRVDDPYGSWAYFQRPGVYREVKGLLSGGR